MTDTQIGKGHRFAKLRHKKICYLSSLFPESSVQNIQGVALSWYWLLLSLVLCVFLCSNQKNSTQVLDDEAFER